MLETNFLVSICSGNLGNRSLCGLELGFLSENNHEAEKLKNLDEFLVSTQTGVFYVSLTTASGPGIGEFIVCETEE